MSEEMAGATPPPQKVVLHGGAPAELQNPDNAATRALAAGPGGELIVRSRPDKPVQPLASKELSDSDTEIFTAKVRMIDCSLVPCNNSGGAITLQLHLVPDGDSSGDDNLISTKGQALTATDPPVPFLGFSMEPGMSLRGLCSVADGVTVYVQGRPG